MLESLKQSRRGLKCAWLIPGGQAFVFSRHSSKVRRVLPPVPLGFYIAREQAALILRRVASGGLRDAVLPRCHYLSMSNEFRAKNADMTNPAIGIAIEPHQIATAFSRSIRLHGDGT